LVATPDSRVNYEDLFVFGAMWNWFHYARVGLEKAEDGINTIRIEDGKVILHSVDGISMIHTSISFDASQTTIRNLKTSNSFTGFITNENGTIDISLINLPDFGENADLYGEIVLGEIAFEGSNSFVVNQVKALDGEGKAKQVAFTDMPSNLYISAVTPNPFNPASTITVKTPSSGRIVATLHDALGRQASVIEDREIPAGIHKINVTPDNLPSGVYYIRITMGDRTEIRKAVYLK
jgi:hypothetical protein